jgi:sodium/proline symporter
MIIARVTVVAVSVIAIFLAANPNSSVFGIVSFAWAGFGAAFGPVILCALFWKRANKQGAIAGMLAGGITIFIWKFVVRKLCAGTVLDIYELLPAFIVGLIVIVVVSLLTPAPSLEITNAYEEVKENCKGF